MIRTYPDVRLDVRGLPQDDGGGDARRGHRGDAFPLPRRGRAVRPGAERPRFHGEAHVRAHPERYREFVFYPCKSYAGKRANAVREEGVLGALKRFLPEGGFRPIAMLVLASGAIPAREALECVCRLPIESVVFGASSRANIRQTMELIDSSSVS